MRAVITIVLTWLTLASVTWLDDLRGPEGPLVDAGITMATCLVLSCFIGRGITPLALVLGAMGALTQVLLWPHSTILAGGAMFVCLYGTRALRAVGGWSWSAAHILTAMVGGATATWLAAHNGTAPPSSWLVSLVVASLLASAPWAFRADDVVALSLEALALRSSGTTKLRLERAAALRRKLMAQVGVSKAERKRLARVFENILRLGETRIRVGVAGGASLDETIAEHLAALEERCSIVSAREAAVESTRRADAQELRQDNLGVEAEVEALSIGNELRGAE